MSDSAWFLGLSIVLAATHHPFAGLGCIFLVFCCAGDDNNIYKILRVWHEDWKRNEDWKRRHE